MQNAQCSYSSDKLGNLIDLAAAHGVEWLICDELQQISNISAIDKETLLQAKRRAIIDAMRNCATLSKITNLCKKNGLEVLFFKGAALSAFIHGHPAARRYCDIDILVKGWGEAERLKQILVEEDFVCKNDWPESFNSLKKNYHVEFQMVGPDGINVDIHWRLFHDYYVADSLTTRIQNANWNEFPEIDIFGVSVKTLHVEDCLLVIAAHHTMHVWNELRLICDVAGLIKDSSQIDFRQLFRRAEEVGSRRMLTVALNLAAIVFDLSLPLSAIEELKLDRLGRIVAKKLYQRLMTGASDNNRTGSMLLELICRDGWTERLRFLIAAAFQPSDNDFRFIGLRPPWLWCYFLIRPIRQIMTLLGSLR